jgi:hypothetical protein
VLVDFELLSCIPLALKGLLGKLPSKFCKCFPSKWPKYKYNVDIISVNLCVIATCWKCRVSVCCAARKVCAKSAQRKSWLSQCAASLCRIYMSAMPRLSGTTAGMFRLTKPNTLVHACSSAVSICSAWFCKYVFLLHLVVFTANKTNKFASLHSLLKNIWWMGL